MADIIHLLPDSVANQIAAGEVVQRPASAVKELLENSIDSGATAISLIIREAGKALIQVTDNGCGMSERDARMCFERHATSKITSSDDLLRIRTLGFRGEALASIASISQVELRTKRHEDEVGTSIIIEGTEFKGQSPVNCQNGTTVIVKNLFFNVPARRNFLKSNTLELKHILEEFFRVALVNPDTAFSFFNQDKLLYKIAPGNIRQRINNLLGNSYTQKLIPVEQSTDLVRISGYIGKPEFARKQRSEQYFFTNGRYMRSAYLNNAVERAFQELIPDDSNPIYFIYLELDPQTIDINIHPTKTEINFQDSKSIYAILHSAVRQAIGKHNLAPSLDFETETGLDIPPMPKGYEPKQPTITINPGYNPFQKKQNPQPALRFPGTSPETIKKWQEVFVTAAGFSQNSSSNSDSEQLAADLPLTDEPVHHEKATGFQVQKSFILTYTKKGILIVDQQNAHERILYERFSLSGQEVEPLSQPLLFPQTVNLSPDNAELFRQWRETFKTLGFDINDFGGNSFVINAFPFEVNTPDAVALFERTLELLRESGIDAKLSQKQILAKALAKRMCIKRGRTLSQPEIDTLIGHLFACSVPDISPDGKPTMMVIPFEEIYKKLKIY